MTRAQVENYPSSGALAVDSVSFTCGGRLGVVQAILSSTDELTRFMVVPPAQDAAGIFTCTLSPMELAETPLLQFDFKYIFGRNRKMWLQFLNSSVLRPGGN